MVSKIQSSAPAYLWMTIRFGRDRTSAQVLAKKLQSSPWCYRMKDGLMAGRASLQWGGNCD
jgi:hypothetical protein